MKKQCIPFPIDKLDEIRSRGCIVNMSDFSNLPNKYEETSKNIKTMFIYLRNIAMNKLTLDFSECNTDLKSSYCLLWLVYDIENNNLEFINTWMDILFGKNIHGGFFTTEEIEELYKSENNSLIELGHLIYEFAYSLPLYALFRLKDQQALVDISEFETIEDHPFGANIYKLIRHPEFINLVDNQGLYAPKFYSYYFKMENNALFDAIKDTVIMQMAYALTQNNDNCKELAEGVTYDTDN